MVVGFGVEGGFGSRFGAGRSSNAALVDVPSCFEAGASDA
jgi:hypothetical protein